MEIRRKVYLDTSVISALFDTRTPERMELTKASWKTINRYNILRLHIKVLLELSHFWFKIFNFDN